MKKIGTIAEKDEQQFITASNRRDIIYRVMMDKDALWDSVTIDKLLVDFPEGYSDPSVLFLVLTESIANAALHGNANTLGLMVRERAGIVLFSFVQFPPMPSRIVTIIQMVREGRHKHPAENLPGGMGFPILKKLARTITVSSDLTCLRFWFNRYESDE